MQVLCQDTMLYNMLLLQTDIRELMSSVMSAYGSMAQPGVQLSCVVHSEVAVSVLLDPLRIRQIVANGITNSLKVTTAGDVVIMVRTPQTCSCHV